MSANRHPDDGRIVTRRQSDVLVIVIDRPKKLNGFSAIMLDELSAAYSAMERDPDIRCGLLCAEGKNFTAGLELSRLSQRFAEGKPLSPMKRSTLSTCAGCVQSRSLPRFKAFASRSGLN